MSTLPPPSGFPVSTPVESPDRPGGPRRRMRRTTAVGLAAGLLGGSAVGLFAAVPSFTSASGTVTLQDTDTTTDLTDDSTDDSAPDRTERIRELLQTLVDDGTITAAQADAVAGELATALPERGGPGHGGFGRGGFVRGVAAEVVAEALGVTVDELVEAVRDGRTIADLAADAGVDVQVVIDAMVAQVAEHLDAEVADGELTQEEADARLATATERIADVVENGGLGMGAGGRHGRGPGLDDTADGSTTATEA
jgi:polyhydroxyalkanoate synthesis regulator phasin